MIAPAFEPGLPLTRPATASWVAASDYGSVGVTVVVEPDDPPTPNRRPGAAILLVPLFHVGHCVLMVKALLEYALTWEGQWYRVTKVGA